MKNIILALFVVAVSSAKAQDSYFSFFDKFHAMNNPSAMGISNNMNITALYRMQWLGAVSPNGAAGFEFSYPIKQKITNKKLLTVGVSFLNDRSGDGGFYTTNQVAGHAFYQLKMAPKHFASLGLKFGYIGAGTNVGNLTSGSQWTGTSHNPDAALGENITNSLYHQFEISPSVTYYFLPNNRTTIYAGATVFNANQPLEFQRDNNIAASFKRPMRIAANIGASIGVKRLKITPSLIYTYQGSFHTGAVGTDVFYNVSSDKRHEIGLGVFYRVKESPFVRVQYNSDVVNAGIAYDIPATKLTKLGNGSIEIYLNVPIGVKRKAPKFSYSPTIYDNDTKQPVPANVSAKSRITGEQTELLNNQSEGQVELEVKNDYELVIRKEGYKTKTIDLKQNSKNALSQEIYLEPLNTQFDFEMAVRDKETDEIIPANIYHVNKAGEKELVSSNGELNQGFNVKEPHRFIIEKEDYHPASLDVKYDKFGTLNKTVYLNEIKPEIPVSKLNLRIVDEETGEELGATVMATDITNPAEKSSSVLSLNEKVQRDYPILKDRKFDLTITKEGYFNKTVQISTDGETTNQEVRLSPIEVGKKMVIENFHFKTGSAEVDLVKSERALQLLEDLMNSNPTLRVEISGHTDSDGSDAFNQTLSEKRAKAAMDVIIDRGIDASRIISIGKGETEPVAPNDSAENKALNRRVELKIIK